jgi:predicted nucleic acid-binding protein
LYLYFDASALVKRYAVEPGQPIVNELFRLLDVEQLYLSYWSVTEAVSVLVRKRNRGDLTLRDMRTATSRLVSESLSMQEESVDSNDARASIQYITRYNLNATDALHLFLALRMHGTLKKPVVMVSSDSRLLRAAGAEGLITLNPETSSLSDVRRFLRV